MKQANSSGRTMHSVVKFRRLTGNRKQLLGEAALLLPAAWFLVRALPFRWWSSRLGTSVPGEVDPAQAAFDARSLDITWALKAINRRVGGRFTCLMLAMAAQWMLNRRGISSSLVLGTCNELNDRQELDFKAHAWLRVGSHTVLGQHGGRFTAVTSFIKTPGHNASGHSP
ncbi:lasso peptide biosynthesis B2 protein [Halomonas campisalis]|uniref:Lasso peptide biosynthesis B2 protein n=1 Tax=Billgrantia campisalis TaxID=74661 RepID=A0ABS9P4J0_9GAMM|nr:lasso peptide biosynthesis B2 protein [Halomonas campisalis]MCG6656324.1 lasso peptide biosynthesis B2 protein [Halomonas campisalis]MDR5861510.1 lasso peptide biosynthesis B2 protein [Halomonas campisalis]